jgi:hypothetical protein
VWADIAMKHFSGMSRGNACRQSSSGKYVW